MAEEKKRGRPSTGKRGTFTFRVTDQLRSRLISEAEAAQRPVSEIVENRLERSFAEEDLRQSGPLSIDAHILAGDIARAATLAEALTGEEWSKPGRARQALKAAIQELLEPTADAARTERDNRNALVDAVLVVAGKKPATTELPADMIGREIADAITKPRLRMGGILGTEPKA